MKILLLFLFLFVSLNICRAEQTCGAELKDAPSFFGLNLGMTEEQVRDILGKELKLKPKKSKSERTFFQNFISKPPPSFLPEVRAVYLRFYERKLYQIEFFYENRAEWQTLAEFISLLPATQNLPNQLWTIEKDKAEIKCVDFVLRADKVLNPRIELTDELTRAKVLVARKKKR